MRSGDGVYYTGVDLVNTLFGYPATLTLRAGEDTIEVEDFLKLISEGGFVGAPEVNIDKVLAAIEAYRYGRSADAAVEDAAVAIWYHNGGQTNWSAQRPDTQNFYRGMAKAALDAARDAGAAQ